MYHYVVTLPTSMLYYHELTQLEMLMQQIDRSPPLFSASQIFPFHAAIVTNVSELFFCRTQRKLPLNPLSPPLADVWSCYNVRLGGHPV